MDERKVRIGRLAGPLSAWQAEHVRERLLEVHPNAQVEILELKNPNGKVETKPSALHRALREEHIDVGVQRGKDLPKSDPKGVEIAAVLERGVVNEAIICPECLGVKDMCVGMRVGVNSMRRLAQLRNMCPELHVEFVDRNIEDRLHDIEMGQYNATLASWVDLRRMGLAWRIDDVLSLNDMLPAPTQGITVMLCRREDKATKRFLAGCADLKTMMLFRAERSFVKALRVGNDVAVSGLARHYGLEGMKMVGRVLSADGSVSVEHIRTIDKDEKPEVLGRSLAENITEHETFAPLRV